MGKVSFLKKRKLYFSPLEIKILKNILEMFFKKKKKKIIINTGFFSFLIYDYITCQHAACIYACRHSPKSDPPSLILSLSLSLSLLSTSLGPYLPWQAVYPRWRWRTGRLYVAPSHSSDNRFPFSGSLSIEMCHTFLEIAHYSSK